MLLQLTHVTCVCVGVCVCMSVSGELSNNPSQPSCEIHFHLISLLKGFPSGLVGKESACGAGDLGSLPESGRSPGEGNSSPLQYSCL